MLGGETALLLLALVPCAPAARPILAEVFYDAIGDDTGHEYVELFNPASMPFALLGLRLEAGDGSSPGRWSVRWTGAIADTIPAQGRFVIGGTRVEPPPQRIASLDLQNGPDAIRLTWPDGEVETLGYGPHEFQEYACGMPAVDVAAGQALARIPDDSNRGENALDFRSASPTPGRANQPRRDAGWERGSLRLHPERPAIGEPAVLSGRLANRGSEPLAAGEAVVRGSSRGSGDYALFEVPLAIGLAPGESAPIEVSIAHLPAGKQILACRLLLPGDEAPANDVDSLLVRVGPGPLELTEIQFHPGRGEGEWIEIRNRTAEVLELGPYQLSDRAGTRGRLVDGAARCDPGSLVVLAQDRDALLGLYTRLDAARIWHVRPWPSLNNTDDPSGIADVVSLREADGTLCDQVRYSAATVPAGVPLERQGDDTWWPALDPSGSPLEPARAPAPLRGRFEIRPRRVRPEAGSARLAWSLPWPRGRVAVDVYGLDGARVSRALGEIAAPGRGEYPWQVAGLAPGLYVLVLRAREEGGPGSLSAAQVLRVDGVTP